MKKSKEEILRIIKKKLVSVSPDAKVILYGSQTRGDARQDSDWDLLVVLNKTKIEAADLTTFRIQYLN